MNFIKLPRIQKLCSQICYLSSPKSGWSVAQTRQKSDLYEPDYLVSMIPDIPEYDCLNIQLKSYDFRVIESYQKFIHKWARLLELEIDECWATPAQQLKVQRYKTKSTVVDSEYQLNLYERNVQVSDVPATVYPILLRVLQETLPEGVSLSVHEADEDQQEIRYVPDNQLLALKKQLTDMEEDKINKKK